MSNFPQTSIQLKRPYFALSDPLKKKKKKKSKFQKNKNFKLLATFKSSWLNVIKFQNGWVRANKGERNRGTFIFKMSYFFFLVGEWWFWEPLFHTRIKLMPLPLLALNSEWFSGIIKQHLVDENMETRGSDFCLTALLTCLLLLTIQ